MLVARYTITSARPVTNVKLTAATVAGETTVPGTAGILTRNAGIEVNHALRRWLSGTAKFNFGYDDYVGSARKDGKPSIDRTKPCVSAVGSVRR